MRNIFYLLAVALLLSGCGKSENKDANKDKKDTATVKEETPPKNNTNGSTTGEKTETDEKQQNTSGDLNMTPGLPKDFPADVPQPKDGKCLGSLGSSEGTVVTFQSPATVKDIVAFYKDEMKKNGYQIQEGETVSDKGGLLEWKKESKSVGMMLGYNQNNQTEIVITYK
jgi:uncharacterized protein YceK